MINMSIFLMKAVVSAHIRPGNNGVINIFVVKLRAL